MLAGYLVDALRKAIDGNSGPATCQETSESVGGTVTSFSAYRVILLTGAGTSLIMFGISFFAIRYASLSPAVAMSITYCFIFPRVVMCLCSEIDLNARGETNTFTPRVSIP